MNSDNYFPSEHLKIISNNSNNNNNYSNILNVSMWSKNISFDKSNKIKEKQDNIMYINKITYGQTEIKGEYYDDLNLISIHNTILKKIKYDNSNLIKQLENEKSILKEKISQPQTKIERERCKSDYSQIREQINMLKEEKELKYYLHIVFPLLETYKSLPQITHVINLSSQNLSLHENKKQQNLRFLTIERFIDIAKKYIDINIDKIENKNLICNGCSSNLYIDDIIEDGIITCNNCGAYRITYLHNFKNDEDNHHNSGSNNDFIENIISEMKEYQGKKKKDNIPNDIEDKLDIFFRQKGLPIGLDIRKFPLQENGKRGSVNISLMIEALKETKLSAYYGDVYLICHKYWGWNLQDISHLENKIVEDCKKIYPIFEKNKGIRKSNMGYQYILWRELDRHGHICSPDDFKIVTTPNILQWYEKMWILFCKELNWDPPVPIYTKSFVYNQKYNINL